MFVFQRYVAKNILLAILIFTFLFTGLIWIFQTLKFIYLIDKDITLTQFCGFISLLIPYLLFIILPFSTVISVIYTYNRLVEERQLIILRNAGLSNIGLAKPALLVATIVTIFSLYTSAVLVPNSWIQLKTKLSTFHNNYFSSIIIPKTFNQISKNVTIYVDKKLSDNTIEGIIIFDDRTEGASAIIFAKYGKLQTNSKGNLILQLVKGRRQSYDKNNNLSSVHFASIIFELTSDTIKATDHDNGEYYINDLLNPRKDLSITKQNKLFTEGHQRLIWPIYSLLLTFVGLAVFLQMPYNKKSNFNQLLLPSLTIIVVTCIHFILLNMANKNSYMIIGCYINFIFVAIVSGLFYLPRINWIPWGIRAIART